MSHSRRIGLLVCAALVWLAGPIAGAQTGGRINGLVSDQSGRGVIDATVIISRDGSDDVAVRTDDDGRFQSTGLAAGTYAVTAIKAALSGEIFRVYVRDGATASIHFVLEPGRHVANWMTEADALDARDTAFAAGIDAFGAGELIAAIDAFERTIALDSFCVSCRFNLAVTYAAAGRLDDAEQTYRAALELDPGYVAAYRELAKLYDTLRRPDDAAAARAQADQLEASAGSDPEP